MPQPGDSRLGIAASAYRLDMSEEMAKVIKLFREAPQETEMERIHGLWEVVFLRHGLTLTDPDAAEALRAAIAAMDHLLDGAFATEAISEEQRDTLRRDPRWPVGS